MKNEPEVNFKSAAGHWVVAKRDYIDPSKRAGIILTAAGMAELQKEVATGTALCVGPGGVLGNGTRLDKPCQGGDRILWSRYGERIVQEREDGDVVAIPFQEVVGVVVEAKAETPVVRGLTRVS